MTRARDVADAGHATTATTADTISQKTSIDLSGTYSTHQLLVADAYNFAGDTTVNDNLILGKLSDDGTDTVLEGSYILKGTGQLEAGYVTSSGIGNVDGMTGTLGSGVTLGNAVTGSPALNLGNTTGTFGSGVAFPAGHQLQMVQSSNDLAQVTSITSNSPAQSNSLPYVDITPKATNSKYHMYGKLYIGCDPGPSQPVFAFSVSTDGGSSYTHKIGSSAWSYGSWFTWNQLNGEWTVFFEDWYQSSFSADQANIRFAMCYWNVYHSTSQYAFNAGTGEDHGGHVIIKEIAT